MRIGVYRTRRKNPLASPKVARRFLADVDHLAEAVAEHCSELRSRGLGDLATPLQRALERLGG